jgi:hypothetical protein
VNVPGILVHVDKWRAKHGQGVGARALLYFDPISCRFGARWEDLPVAQMTQATGT